MDETIAAAAAEIDRLFAEKAGEIAAEQVRLALQAESEDVRAKVGQRIVEHIKGSPIQRIDQRVATTRLVTHMSIPGVSAELPPPAPGLPSAPDVDLSKAVRTDTEPGLEDVPSHSPVLAQPRSPRRFRAAVSPATGRSRYQLDRRMPQDPKNQGPLGVVPEGPEPEKL